MLGNPICVVAYFAASWRFFNHRIYYEERLLSEVQFPGNKEGSYKKYCETRWIGIPFIQGFDVHIGQIFFVGTGSSNGIMFGTGNEVYIVA